jgi:iron complex outermembrane receptor protein
MSRKKILSLGVSAIALSLVATSYAEAQQNLPVINVGNQAKRTGGKPSGNPNASRTNAPATPLAQTSGQGTGISELPDRYATPAPVPFQRSLPANIPAVVESKSRAEIESTVNMVTTAEAFKYLPSLYIRERFIGDQNAIISGRVNSGTESAQTMLYADGVLLSNYLGNSFAYPPRWNMVSPEEIERIDVIYGPFSALYQGNSVGGVLNIKTRMPEGRELHVRGVGAAQTFSYLGYTNTPLSGTFNVLYGDKLGDNFRYFVAWNHLDSSGQPMSYSGNALATSGAATAGTQFYGGAFKYDQNGYPALYTGAYSISRTVQDLGKVKMSYDIAPETRVYYQAGFWTNNQNTDNWTGVKDTRGVPIYNGTFAMGSPRSWLTTNTASTGNASPNTPGHQGQQHLMNSIQIKRDSGKEFDFEATFSQYNYMRDFSNSANNWGPIPVSSTAPIPSSYVQNQTGRNTNLSGTFWRNGDVRMIYRPNVDLKGKHEFSFGTHSDLYSFNQNQQLVFAWPDNLPMGYTNFNKGKTTLQSLYAQDAWKITDNFKIIGGARGDWWNAYNGNLVTGGPEVGSTYNGVFPVVGPRTAVSRNYKDSSKGGFQPKGAFELKVTDGYEVRGSVGRAYRFPTVTELFQNISTASSNVVSNPYLQPAVSTAYDFTQSWRWVDAFNGSVGLLNPRVSLFYEDRWNSIFQQQTYVDNANRTTNSNIGKTRFRGVEAALVMKDLIFNGLGYSGSVTFTDAKILNNDDMTAPGTGAPIPLWQISGTPLVYQRNGRLLNGNFYPGIPPIKMRSVFTYAPTADWEVTFASTYNSAAWQTATNIDVNHDTLYSISQMVQFDMKANWRFEKNWKASFGIDNIGNYKAFYFHPLAQRTFYAGINYDFGGPADSLQAGAQNQTGAWDNQSGTRYQ